MTRRAKIVATFGPAVASYESAKALVEAGIDVARLNMSHGAHEVHEENFKNIRRAAEETGRAVAILADLQGPKIRLGKIPDGPHLLREGDTFKITTADIPGNKEMSSTTYKGLIGDVKVDDFLLIDDGKVRVQVTEVSEDTVTTKVIVGGDISSNKGINLPGVAVSVPALSEKDEDDLRWAIRLGIDLIALSFVRSPEDIKRAHQIMEEEGKKLPVIAKIEKPQAVEVLPEIVYAFDGIMVARGDLGVELPLEQVPIVQKEAVQLARTQARPVIVATQMLESMTNSPIPTRAETSDVANAIIDGADAVMLSGETSVGQYPILTVQTMARIVSSTEAHGLSRIPPLGTKPRTQAGAITAAAVEVAEFVEAKYLCVFTETGESVRRITRLRSSIPILAFTPSEEIRRRMALNWGVTSFLVGKVTHTDQMVAQVDDVLYKNGLAVKGEKVVMVSGSPPGIPGTTNDIRVHVVGEVI